MPIREAQLTPLHPIAVAQPAGRATRAASIRQSSVAAGRSAGGVRQKLSSGLEGVLSIFNVAAKPGRDEKTGRDGVAAGLVRIEALLANAIAGAKTPAEAETLIMGQTLVNEMGRRLHLLRSGGLVATETE